MLDNALYNDFVERVYSSSDILKVISSYVPLKKRGHNYWGCCPFHRENTPSFSVVPDEGFFYCFGCHKGGNVFKFLSLIENISYGEAIKLQAERLNIPVPKKKQSEAQLKKALEIKNLYKIHEMAQTFFYNCLTKTGYGKPGIVYLQKRGINKEIIEKFHLGFAPPGWDKLSSAFIKRGISEELLLQVGLVVKKKSKGCYDRFRERIMIPIIDEKGRTVGFGARILNSGQPKYLNSPETPLFNKRRLLFGLNEAGKFIRQQEYAIIVEGYMDAIALASNGVSNVVASLGTAFTAEQCKKLMRYSPNIYFCYDSDAAGQTATIRALSIARNSGANVKVILLPDGKDPDEFIRKHGSTAFSKLIDKALNFIDFHLYHIMHTIDYASLDGKVKAVSFILPVLASVNNLVESNGYTIRIAQALGIDETDLRAELQKYRRNKSFHEAPVVKLNPSVDTSGDNAVVKAGRYIINKIWHEPDILDYVLASISIDELDNQFHREILSFAAKRAALNQPINDINLSQLLSDEACVELSRCIVENKNESDANLLDDYLKTIHLAYLKKSYREHSLKADELERKGDNGFQQELKEIQRIIKEMDEVN
ncbi:DNA primase [Pectinatus cerevisiiphilus]|uniref:DNA primase n=1 Tax=Pectinatus cerevisiiphilus TaxID=86956 RepID=A0A4R3K8W6_9FIRM|nr:DNA primase [Pectinatus cerevisiiphilus]TCS79263.1 DNA primase [Pectinatus cerevisiiphilus]